MDIAEKRWKSSVRHQFQGVIAAAKAAWQRLDISQYAAGIKTMLDAENPEKTPEKDAVFGDSDSPVEGL
jgi:hypothetical protein